MVYAGGERAFILKIVNESLAFEEVPALLFAIFVGVKDTLSEVKNSFKLEKRIVFFHETVYQGNTARWVLYWRVTARKLHVPGLRTDHIGTCSSPQDTHHATQTTFPCGEHDLHDGS